MITVSFDLSVWENLLIETRPADKLVEQGLQLSPADPDVFLRYLTENESEHRSMRTGNDRLFDILCRNLNNPQGKDRWTHLAGDNRAVQIFINREHVWTLSTTAVRVSDAMFKSWVARADEMRDISRHPAFRV